MASKSGEKLDLQNEKLFDLAGIDTWVISVLYIRQP